MSQNTDIKILIVDDTPTNIQVVASVLNPLGYQLSFARNGISALKMISGYDYDLVLLDIMMPGMDGYEVCSKLKEHESTSSIPVIFLTARTDSDSIFRAFSLGAADYLTKPFNAAELTARVENQVKYILSQRKLKHANMRLTKILAMKDRLFSIIGHDLRGPISSMHNLLEIVLNETSNLKNESLNHIISLGLQSTNETLTLLENLLYWAKAEQGDIPFSPRYLVVSDLVYATLNLLQTQIEDKNLNISTTFENNITLYADENMLKTIFRNIISNAIKFSHLGGTIFLKAYVVDGRVEFRIEDQGVGISDVNLKKILNPSEHITTFGTKNEKGSGLGLMLCVDFIKKHNGFISVESKLGKGSSFLFSLPMKPLDDIIIG